MGFALRALLISDSNSCLKDRKVSGKLIRKCAPGIELVDWLMNLSPIIQTRAQAASCWQALLEEGVLTHGNWIFLLLFFLSSLIVVFYSVSHSQAFKDKVFLYKFTIDEDGNANNPSTDDISNANDIVKESLTHLLHRGPDAALRLILRKP